MPFPDFATLRRALTRSISRQIRPGIEQDVRRGFGLAKADLINYINLHPISVELRERGELFGFFGFQAGDDPVGQLLDYLDDQVQVTFSPIVDLKGRVFVQFPSKEDLRRGGILNLPWEPGKSWVEGVESGFPNFSNFLPRDNKGRSRKGIQVQGNVNAFSFTPVPYLSEGLRLFRGNLARFIRR